MGMNMNAKNFGNDNGGLERPPGQSPLTRQSSVYSLTFDEFMTTGGMGKDVGSMNMDELLKNIWTAEELQTVAAAGNRQEGAGGGGNSNGIGVGGNLQRQGSLTLPRTLSQKTVDEVWKDISKEYSLGKNGGVAGDIGSNFTARQQTLGEITLEEFLVRAGVVREDTQFATEPHSGVFGDFSSQGQANSNAGLGFGFQQLCNNTSGLTGTIAFPGSNDHKNVQSSTNLPLNVNGVRSNLRQHQQQHQSQPHTPRQHQQQIFPKQPPMPFANRMASPTSVQLSGPGTRNGIGGIADQGLSAGLVQGSAFQGGGMGMVRLGPAPVTVATGSPANQLSSDGTGKSNDTPSVSPVAYMFNGGLRGRRSNGAVEKVVERRQRRMIKNRESAARSRARKQAYTMELEAEVAKLKEENEELLRKQEEMTEMQKKQVMEMINMQRGVKKRCLRRTQTGPW